MTTIDAKSDAMSAIKEEPVEHHDVEESVPDSGVRVRTHPGLCEGWGNCHRWAPHVYPLDEEGHVDVHMLDVPAEHAERAWIGASVCPETAITVIGPPEHHWADRRRAMAAEAASRAARGEMHTEEAG